jgi:hypothetical protein
MAKKQDPKTAAAFKPGDIVTGLGYLGQDITGVVVKVDGETVIIAPIFAANYIPLAAANCRIDKLPVA